VACPARDTPEGAPTRAGKGSGFARPRSPPARLPEEKPSERWTLPAPSCL
jgi:hypothetical protein